MSKPTDATQFATLMLPLIQRFMGNRPDALAQMRAQVENELAGGRDIVARAEAQLAAIDQLESLIDREDTPPAAAKTLTAPPLKKAILQVLDEDPGILWHRDELYAELVRRGWGPGGKNPRNTYTSRLRDLEKEKLLRRIGRDEFMSLRDEGVPAM